MKKILKVMKNEFLYLSYSKIIYLLLLGLFVITAFNTYSNIKALQDAYNQYEQTKRYYIEKGENIEELLRQNLNVTEKKLEDERSEIVIDNPLKYDFEEVGRALNALRPMNLTVSILEMVTFLFGPFIFSLFGVVLSTYDFRNKTIKLKSIQHRWPLDLFAKQLVNWSSIAIVTVIFIFAARLISEVVYSYVSSGIKDVVQFSTVNTTEQGNIAIKIIISILVSCLFSSIGFTMGALFKKSTAPIVVLALYNFFIPVLGKYDLKNLISVIGHRFYEFRGRFQLFASTEINFTFAIVCLVLTFITLIFINTIVGEKQSKYIV